MMRTLFIKMMRILHFPVLLFGALFFLTAGCKLEETAYEKRVKQDDQIIKEYIASHSISAEKHQTGFYFQKLISNEGQMLKVSDVVNFYYKVSLINGRTIDSISPERHAPARLKLLNYAIIPQALDNGIAMMKTGETFRFFVPSYLGFADYGTELFPGRSIFIIEIQVVNVETESGINEFQLDSIQKYVDIKYPDKYQKFGSGLFYIETLVGAGDKPLDGHQVKINITTKYLDGTVIKTTEGKDPVFLYVGSDQATKGLSEGLKQMRPGGKAILVMPASIAFGPSLCLVPEKTRKDLVEDAVITSRAMPYAMIQYEVELLTR